MRGFALVTENGISFWDEMYSTSAALKEGWYQQSVGFLVEVVAICPLHQQILIKYRGTRFTCRKLVSMEGLPSSTSAAYFAGVQRLKQQIKGRSPGTIQ
jgi:hypothetical protein